MKSPFSNFYFLLPFSNFHQQISNFLVRFALFLCLILLLSVSKTPVHAAEKVYYIHQDHLGSTSLVTDDQGQVIGKQVYYPFGLTRQSGNLPQTTNYQLPTERQYTSQVSDQTETGLYYYNARYYNPQIAKFTQADNKDDRANRYLYVVNNPVKMVDPSGYNGISVNEFDYWQYLGEDFDDTRHFSIAAGGTALGQKPPHSTDFIINPINPIPLTPWGQRIKDLYEAYKNTPGWWNGHLTGSFTEIRFTSMILAQELLTFMPSNDDDQYLDLQFRRALAETATRWYYSKCAFESGGNCEGISSNGLFNWLGGGMEVAQDKWRAVFIEDGIVKQTFDPQILTEISQTQGANDLADYIVANMLNPPDPLWKTWRGIEIVERPFYWGNPGLMGQEKPKKFIWQIGQWPEAFYLVPVQ